MLRKNKRYFPTKLALLVSVLIIASTVYALLFFILESRIFAVKALVFVLKIIFALFIMSSEIYAEAKCSWVFFTLLLPHVAIPAYIIFCRGKLTKKETAVLDLISERKPKIEPFDRKMCLKCNDNFAFLREMSNFSDAELYINTSAKYISDAKKMIDMLTFDIMKSKRFIFLEFYTIAAGEVFGNICDLLIEKAKSGVEVKIIYDEIGSLTRLPEEFPSLMREHGIAAVANASLLGSFQGGLNNRNHRKIAVIDGEVAYTGGINLADEYIHANASLGKWKDSAVRIEGEGVDALTYTFLSDFSIVSEIENDFSKYYKYRKKRCKGAALIFSDGPSPFYKEKSGEKIILSMLACAEKSFYVTTPYLVCNREVLSAMRGAVRRGVKLSIAIPAKADRFLCGILTQHYAARLSEIGADIHVYTPGFLHSKTYCCDGKYLMCGTVNLDYRSLCHNFENGILFAEHDVISEAMRDVEEIFSVSEPYAKRKEHPFLRIVGAVMEIFAPLF